jgi:hypothetical protein
VAERLEKLVRIELEWCPFRQWFFLRRGQGAAALGRKPTKVRSETLSRRSVRPRSNFVQKKLTTARDFRVAELI